MKIIKTVRITDDQTEITTFAIVGDENKLRMILNQASGACDAELKSETIGPCAKEALESWSEALFMLMANLRELSQDKE